MMDDDGVASCYSPFRRGTACEVQWTLVGGVQIVIHHVPSSHVAKKRLCMETSAPLVSGSRYTHTKHRLAHGMRLFFL